ncbi:MAG: tRNA uridine-5-carboxymethylaminomethyl(34) synthesis GTPase MnmE [Rhodothermales bacterium]|nr:tRNA uridine-5-carboxymethylaminomethyl(34) synthesis GTPase MnmE [Rhodothermales bacterium]
MDTIAAIATARGRAALAIVRLSGPDAILIAAACFRGAGLADAPSHTVHVGYLVDPHGETIDQVVATLFRAPRSATGEDVVEISCHGGDLAPQHVLTSLLHHGARLAQPGEFTQRAFLNGKLDLAQAEAVADLIHASSSMAQRVSVRQLQGRYSDLLQRLRADLLETCAYIELELDFSEEDVAFADKGRLVTLLASADALLTRLLGSYRLGELVRDGVRVVIGGRPNAGKSTLLNALLGRDRAIVSPVPGTTRDEIEAELEIEGLAFRFVDTAGLRETEDAIEAEGVRRAHSSIEAADALVYVFDLRLGLDTAEQEWIERLITRLPELPVVLVGNKADLTPAPPATAYPLPVLMLSASQAFAEPARLQPLVTRLLEDLGADPSAAETSAVVTNQRHRQHLQHALGAVHAAARTLDAGGGGDTLALDLRAALHELGQITGEITNEDVLDQIFSRFCIGK